MAAGINADYVNPFLIAATKVLKDMVFVDAKVGRPYLKETNFDGDSLLIILGVTGQIKGQAIIHLGNAEALDIASKMCMMPLEQMDDLAKSAVCELGNMILGNAATVFSTKGIQIDITPPTMCLGPVSFMNIYSVNICVPLIYEDSKKIELNISMKS